LGCTEEFKGHCLFLSKSPLQPIPLEATKELRELLQAEEVLLRHAADWKEAVKKIQAILFSHRPAVESRPFSWSAPYFAAEATRACLANGEWEGAKELLALGFEFSANEPELEFLARILAREATLPNDTGRRITAFGLVSPNQAADRE
jgi:hypothetical protein